MKGVSNPGSTRNPSFDTLQVDENEAHDYLRDTYAAHVSSVDELVRPKAEVQPLLDPGGTRAAVVPRRTESSAP